MLNEWNLSQYKTILKIYINQCEYLGSWINLNVTQLVDFGFKIGHAKRFVKKVKNIVSSSVYVHCNTNINNSNNINGNDGNKKDTCIVLLGETGVGKSTLIDSIEAFVNNYSFEQIGYTKKLNGKNGKSQTQECDVKKLRYLNDDGIARLSLIDTPGIGDTSGIFKDEINIDKIIQFLLSDQVSKNKINVFAFLIERGTNRVSIKIQYIINQLKCNLPQFAQKHFIVVLTRSAVELYSILL